MDIDSGSADFTSLTNIQNSFHFLRFSVSFPMNYKSYKFIVNHPAIYLTKVTFPFFFNSSPLKHFAFIYHANTAGSAFPPL